MIRSAMRTVENRWEINNAIFAFGQFREPLENLVFGSRVQSRRGFVQDQELRIAKVSTRQGHFLPLPSGQVQPAFETAAQQLFVAFRQSPDNLIGKALLRGATNVGFGIEIDPSRPRCSDRRSSRTA